VCILRSILQLQTSLITSRRQLEELGQAGQRQEQQATELREQVAALRAERAAAAEETHSAQQELQRVLRELDQCQKVCVYSRGVTKLSAQSWVAALQTGIFQQDSVAHVGVVWCGTGKHHR
jgi:seryl-tRNA synthetase